MGVAVSRQAGGFGLDVFERQPLIEIEKKKAPIAMAMIASSRICKVVIVLFPQIDQGSVE